MSDRIKGWLFFTPAKTEIRFVNEEPGEPPMDVPWEIFVEADFLLARFIEDFRLRREKTVGASFSYYLDCRCDALYDWLCEHLEVIELEDEAARYVKKLA